jgi:predicted transcriptional regulator
MTSKLLQELAHPVKLEILKDIKNEAESEETIAKKVNATLEETAVHLDKLQDVGLVDKKPDGSYFTSPLGQLTLAVLLDLDFVESHLEDFRKLDLSLVPTRFIERLGELKESERMEGAVHNLESVEKLFERADKRISAVANEVMLKVVPIVRDKVSKGADFRFVIDQTFSPPPEFKPSLPQLWRKVWKIPAAIVVTDKDAMVFFLNRELKVDYSIGFMSSEEGFIKWCEDLVDELWNHGEKVE